MCLINLLGEDKSQNFKVAEIYLYLAKQERVLQCCMYASC